MKVNPAELGLFVEVARAGGFREAARLNGKSASWLSETIRRLEEQLGVRLLNRTTRSVVPTEAGARLLERLGPALVEMEAAVDVVDGSRGRPAGTLRLNVPTIAARLVLPAIIPPFLAAYPEVRVEVRVDERFVDAHRRGLRRQASATRNASMRIAGDRDPDRRARPTLRDRRRSGLPRQAPWPTRAPARSAVPCLPAEPVPERRPPAVGKSSERNGEVVRIDPTGPLLVSAGGAVGLAVDAALAGGGMFHQFEDWLPSTLGPPGALEPVLQPWWQSFPRPFLYFPGRRLVPAPPPGPFVDFIKAAPHAGE